MESLCLKNWGKNIKLIKEEKDMKIEYQTYDKKNQSSLIIIMATSLMVRVHSKVSH